nr:helix-turn-helix transcriptional regulator [Lentilactobacillus dabitei]
MGGIVIKNTIRSRRKELKLSQAELSELTLVTRQTINAIENEKYDPSLELAFKLARVLNTTVDELFIYGKEGK